MVDFDRLASLFAQQQRSLLDYSKLMDRLESHPLWPVLAEQRPDQVAVFKQSRLEGERVLAQFEVMEEQTESHIAELQEHLRWLRQALKALNQQAGLASDDLEPPTLN